MQVQVQQLGPGMIQQIQSACSECKGQGERINAKDRCKTCNGRKVSSPISQIYSFVERDCYEFPIYYARSLHVYHSPSQTVRERKILEVHIDKGMHDGQRIQFSGEGDQEPGLEPGDIIIVLEEKEHPVFR